MVKKSIKADNREYMNMLATETEEVAHQGNLWELYTTIKKLSGKFGKPEKPVKDKGGTPIPDEEGQKKRWVEHFEELLNRPAPQDQQDIPPASDDLPIDCDPIHRPRRDYTRPSNSWRMVSQQDPTISQQRHWKRI